MSEPCDWCDGLGGIAISGSECGPVYECQKCNGKGRLMSGGKREGAGRKPLPDGKGKTVPKSIKVSQQMADYLTEHGTGIIEDALRKTKAFREWAKSR